MGPTEIGPPPTCMRSFVDEAVVRVALPSTATTPETPTHGPSSITRLRPRLETGRVGFYVLRRGAGRDDRLPGPARARSVQTFAGCEISSTNWPAFLSFTS